MSHSVYNMQWQHAMELLSALINEENPPPHLDERRKPIASPPVSLYSAFVHSAVLYIRYLSVFRALEDVYDAIIHPQKRKDVRLTLELVMARVMELRRHLLLYSSSQPQALSTPDHVHLEPFLQSMRLPPSALEVPIPRYFTERPEAEEERKRREIVDKLCEENAVMWGTAGQEVGLVSEEMSAQLGLMNRLTREQAIKIIQKNERGRQGAMRARLMKELKEDDARRRLREQGRAPTRDDAAVLIQKTWRGYYARKRAGDEEVEELIFLGLKPSASALSQQTLLSSGPQPPAIPAAALSAAAAAASATSSALPKYEPLVKEQQIRMQRKTRQLDAQLSFSDGLRTLEADIEAEEGEDMKERLWNERYDWWIAEKERTGKYPLDLTDFYAQRYPDSEEAKRADLTAGKKTGAGKAAKKDGKADAKQPAAAKAAKVDKAKDGKGPAGAAAADPNALLLGPSPLVEQLSACVRSYAAVWLGRDESTNPDQQFDVAMAKEALRPLVQKRVQRSVDDRLALYFVNIREKVAEQSAAPGKKGKAKTAKAKQTAKEDTAGSVAASPKAEESKEQISQPQPPSDGAAAASEDGGTARDSAKGKDGGAKGAKAKKCCEGDRLCANLGLQDMTALLIKMNILQALRTATLTLPVSSASPPPATSLRLAALQGDINLVGGVAASALPPVPSPASSAASPPSAAAGGPAYPPHIPPSFQQLRAFFTEQCILPLGSAFVHSTQAAPLRSLLLYGPAGSGKTLVAKSIAHESGSVWFDLSARNVEKKLGTKAEVAKLVHLIFTVARELQPSVLYMDEVDRVFGSAKSKKSAGELSKLRALVLQHAATLERSDRVLIVGCCRNPHSDRVEVKELLDLFGPAAGGKVVLMPLPDYSARRKLWAYFIQQTGLSLTALERGRSFDLDALALTSEGYSAGCIQQAVLSTLPQRRVAKLLELDRGLDSSELITALSQTSYTYKAEYQSNVAWLEQVTGVRDRRKIREAAEQKDRAAQDEDVKAAKPAKKK